MANTIVIGMQWGDEGKGKDIDILAAEHDVIIRYQGGCNAGHTVVKEKQEYKLHLLPSGILREGKINILGNNVVLDPEEFLKEVTGLGKRGISVTPKNLRISDKVHLTLSYHKELDKAKGKEIGTTGKGIGPTYEDKAARRGIRICDVMNDAGLEQKITENIKFYNHVMKYYASDAKGLDAHEEIERLKAIRDAVIPFAEQDIRSVMKKHDGRLLFEGAQGAFLDNDHGTYPYVTSSSTNIGGAFTGTGIGLDFNLERRIGVLKAYTTRVGGGPFPTEQKNEAGERLQKRGTEFGTTTGRIRRCGWLDLFLAKEAVQLNGITELSITKLDVLDRESEIPVGVGYQRDGEKLKSFPSTGLENCIPFYTSLPGWNHDTSKARTFDALPKNAQKYIEYIGDYLNVPVKRVGVGCDREQSILRYP